MSTRYKDDDSLISLKIVEQVETGKNVKIYKLTEFGKEIIQSMRERD
jgi:predicted transcriptional regulator with HTH domain